MRIGNPGMSARERWIEPHCSLEMFERPRQALSSLAVQKKTTFQIKVICLGVRRAAASPGCLASCADQPHPKRTDDRSRNLILHLEDVTHLAIEIVRPHLVAVIGVDELCRDAKFGSCTSHTSLQNRVDAERVTDGADV